MKQRRQIPTVMECCFSKLKKKYKLRFNRVGCELCILNPLAQIKDSEGVLQNDIPAQKNKLVGILSTVTCPWNRLAQRIYSRLSKMIAVISKRTGLRLKRPLGAQYSVGWTVFSWNIMTAKSMCCDSMFPIFLPSNIYQRQMFWRVN